MKVKFVKWVEREFSLTTLNMKSFQMKKFLKIEPTLPPHTYTCICWGKGFWEKNLETAQTLEEKCEDEPWKHLLINILWGKTVRTRWQTPSFWVHQGNPVKNFRCLQSPESRSVKMMKPLVGRGWFVFKQPIVHRDIAEQWSGSRLRALSCASGGKEHMRSPVKLHCRGGDWPATFC